MILTTLNKHHGFTLVELMVAITLGLLISAAAIQIFLTTQRSLITQQGSSNLQNSALFGLESIVRDIRLANLNASQPYIDNETAQGGVVLTGLNLSTKKKADNTSDFTIASNLLSVTNSGESNLVGQQSDQLVIQYRNTAGNKFNCEGIGIGSGDYIVERYFLRQDNNTNNDPNKPLALACKATSYSDTKLSALPSPGLSGNGEIIIPRVDQFKVMLGVARDGVDSTCAVNATRDGKLDCFGYIAIDKYMALTTKPQIVSIKIGLLIRSPDTVGQNEYFDANKDYTIFGNTAKLTAHDRNKFYLRKVVTQTIALRNGFGIEN